MNVKYQYHNQNVMKERWHKEGNQGRFVNLSSFVSGNVECNAVNKNGEHTNTPYHYSGLYFTDSVMVPCASQGDGKIKITQISSFFYVTCVDTRKYGSNILIFIFILLNVQT